MQLNTAQETLLLPLVGRYMASQEWPELFPDRHAAKLSRVFDFSKYEQGKSKMPKLIYGLRYKLNVELAKSYLEEHPQTVVVNLGAGLDSLYEDLDNGSFHYLNLDFPEVIALREKFLPLHARESNLASDLLDFSWLDKVNFNPDNGIIFLSAGVFYYLRVEEVKALVQQMAKKFPGGRLCFDNECPQLIKKSNRLVENSGISNAKMHFILDEPELMAGWSERLSKFKLWTKYGEIWPGYQEIPLRYRLPLNAMGRSKGMYIVQMDFAKEA
ncbi:MAG: class I SAM-dependent methyltransferase [Eubacteriales bacterium]|nr:class I SAM-dependent methyltransferase [Eubacteriales bacterium]